MSLSSLSTYALPAVFKRELLSLEASKLCAEQNCIHQIPLYLCSTGTWIPFSVVLPDAPHCSASLTALCVRDQLDKLP